MFSPRFPKAPPSALAASFLLLALVGPARAGFINDTIHGEYLFPSTTNDYLDLGTKVVSPTAIFDNAGINVVTVYDNYMILTTPIPTDSKTKAAFNGFGLIDANGDYGISSFAVDPSTNVVGFVASDVTVLGNEVLINIEGLTLTSSESIKLDFTFNSPVPEPSSFALCGIAGAVGVAFKRARRKPSSRESYSVT